MATEVQCPHIEPAPEGVGEHLVCTAVEAGGMAHEQRRTGAAEMVQREPDADVGVSVLGPGIVRTNIATAQRNRPEQLRRRRRDDGQTMTPEARAEARRRNERIAAALAEEGMDPAEVANEVVQAMYDRRFWVLSHPELLTEVNHRNRQLAALENPTLDSAFAAD